MVLRNVPSTATFEEQRVEINELAVDVEALDAAALKAESDTLQTVTGRGFTTTNPIKIENNAATAFVVEDGSSNEKFVVDSVNGKINVGSSAGGAGGIYLFHNNAGATPAITLDGATGSITNKGQLVTESILSSAALNNKGSLQFGTVDAYSIGHMPLNSNLAFSQTHGGSYLFYSDASTVELEIASGGITVDGSADFANGGASISSSGTGSFNLLSLKNVSGSIGGSGGTENWIGFKHGSTFGLNLKTAGTNTGYVGINTTTPASRLDVNHPSAPGIRVGGNGGGGDYHLEMGQINTNGSPGINATGTSTSLKFQINGTEVARFNVNGKFINVAGAEFADGALAIASSGNLSIDRTAGTHDILNGKLNGSVTSTINANGSASFGDASNSTGNNGVLVGGDNGTLNLYTDRYTTDCFQIVNTSGSGTNVTLKAYGNGDLELAGIIQTNTKSAGHLELDSTGAFTSPKLKLFSNTGDITTAGALTFTGQTSTAASGSSSSSDAFDHYEEGVWSPTPLGLSNSPTFSNLKGRFVRIGSLVQIHGFIQMGSSPTWNNVNDFFMLGPLPFNYNADNAGYFATAGSVTCQNFNFHDNDYNNTGQVNCAIANSSSVSYVVFVVSDNNNTRGTVKNSAISGSDIIEFSLTYRAG